jgi:hypothetical protein
MKNANKIINDPTKSTLFGRFYEKILLNWLEEKKGFTPSIGKPRIYWKDVEFKREVNGSTHKLKEALERIKKDKQFCTPDGLFKKDDKYYIWEAKNWPLWDEGKLPLDQLTDLLFSVPFFLATKAVYKTKDYKIAGFLFSWWSQPENVEFLLMKIKILIAPRTFEIFYTANIIEDCIKNKYPWYLQIIENEKTRASELFEDLLGNSNWELN